MDEYFETEDSENSHLLRGFEEGNMLLNCLRFPIRKEVHNYIFSMLGNELKS